MLINRSYRLQCLKRTVTFEEQIKTTLILCIKVTWCRSKKNTIDEFWQFLVHSDMTATKRGTLLEKTPQTILSWWNQFWNTNANFSVTLRTRKLQNKKLTQIWKKLIPTNLAVKFAKTSKKKRSVSNFFRLYLNNNWGHCPRLVCTSWRVQFFSSSAGQKNSSGTSRASNDHVS